MLMTSNQKKEAKANQDEYGDAIEKKFYTDEKSLNDEEEPNATSDESTNADKVKTEESC